MPRGIVRITLDEVTLYQHGIGNTPIPGWAARFPVGSYGQSDLLARGARNDDASSITVRLALGRTLFSRPVLPYCHWYSRQAGPFG